MATINEMRSPVRLTAYQSDLFICGMSQPARGIDTIILSDKFSEALIEHCETAWCKLVEERLCPGFDYDGVAHINCMLPLVTFRNLICNEFSIKSSNPDVISLLRWVYTKTRGWRDLGVDEIVISAIDVKKRTNHDEK